MSGNMNHKALAIQAMGINKQSIKLMMHADGFARAINSEVSEINIMPGKKMDAINMRTIDGRKLGVIITPDLTGRGGHTLRVWVTTDAAESGREERETHVRKNGDMLYLLLSTLDDFVCGRHGIKDA